VERDDAAFRLGIGEIGAQRVALGLEDAPLDGDAEPRADVVQGDDEAREGQAPGDRRRHERAELDAEPRW